MSFISICSRDEENYKMLYWKNIVFLDCFLCPQLYNDSHFVLLIPTLRKVK